MPKWLEIVLAGTGITALFGFLGTIKECADCTIRGVTKQPDFWK